MIGGFDGEDGEVEGEESLFMRRRGKEPSEERKWFSRGLEDKSKQGGSREGSCFPMCVCAPPWVWCNNILSFFFFSSSLLFPP